MLEAGQVHDAHDVVIPWPLKLVGSGHAAEDTLLVCPKGPEAALDFRYPLSPHHLTFGWSASLKLSSSISMAVFETSDCFTQYAGSLRQSTRHRFCADCRHSGTQACLPGPMLAVIPNHWL